MFEFDLQRVRFGQVMFYLAGIGLGALGTFSWYLIYTPQAEVANALSNVVGGIFGGVLGALSAYVAVRETLLGQARAEQVKQEGELSSIRAALYTEVGMVSAQCFLEHDHWSDAVAHSVWKPAESAILYLRVFNGLVPQLGRLSREEAVALIQFAGTLDDVRKLAENSVIAMREAKIRAIEEGVQKQQQPTLALLFSNACGYAADFMKAVPSIERDERDAAFISQLESAFKSKEGQRQHVRFTAAN